MLHFGKTASNDNGVNGGFTDRLDSQLHADIVISNQS